MIRYQLACANDHQFESWFRDSSSFDTQVNAGLLSCPACGTDRVAKSIMAPAVVGAVGRREIVARDQPGAPAAVALLDDRQQALRAALRELRTQILAQGEDVGSRFPEQARQMHDGEIPARPIRGEATPQEARGLIEDGIPILPIPMLPEELN
jgi:hypothetical protein